MHTEILPAITSFARNTELTEEQVQELNAVRMDREYTDPHAALKIYAWLDGEKVFWWSNAETTKLTDRANLLFSSLQNASVINVSGIDISELTKMSYMFANCYRLRNLPGIRSWDTGSVRHMLEAFSRCYSFQALDDLAGWDLSNIQCMDRMFYQCIGVSVSEVSALISRRDIPASASMEDISYGCQREARGGKPGYL